MKKIYIIIFLILLTFLVGCENTKKYEVKEDDYLVLSRAYIANGENFIIKTLDDYNKYIKEDEYCSTRYSDLLTKYDKSFFKSKSLIVLQVNGVSGLNKYKINSYEIDLNKVIVNIAQVQKGITDDSENFVFLLEVNTSTIKNIDEIEMNLYRN